MAAALAATSITDDQLQQLEVLMVRMHEEEEVAGEDADREFHMIIARATGNGAIMATIENLWDWRNRSPLARNILTRARGMGLEPRINEHRRVYEALKAREIGCTFAMTPADSALLGAVFLGAGYRRTGVLSRHLAPGERRADAMLWVRRTAGEGDA